MAKLLQGEGQVAMRLNVRRGLFRLWIVLSCLWTILICITSIAPVREEFAKASS
jgi:hypothetical protein